MNAPEWVKDLSALQAEYKSVKGITFHSSWEDFLFVKLSATKKQLQESVECLEIYWKRGCKCSGEHTPQEQQTPNLCDVCNRTSLILNQNGKLVYPSALV